MTDYLNGFHYENGILLFFSTAGGYVNVTQNPKTGVRRFSYVYNYTDHLGNIRLSYTKGTGENSPVILEENHYYPFGLKHKKYGSVDKDLVCVDEDCYEVGIDIVSPQTRKAYQYKFNGKEFQDELGLNLYDFHFRQYMQDLGRTTTLDPLAEMFYDLSPYSFLNNNPIRFIDPDGKMSIDGLDNEYKIYKKGGEVQSVEYVSDKGGNKVDFITEVNLDKRSIDPSAYKSYYIPVQNETETRPTPFASQDGQIAGIGVRVPGYNLDVRYKAQSQAIQPMEFDSPFFVVGGLLKNIFTKTTVAKGGTSVLGHYPEYVKLAESTGARTFQIPTNIWNKMTPTEQWTANTKFLDRMISRGDNIRLATPLNQVKPGSFYQKELNYLFDKGYKASSDGLRLVK